LSFLTALQIAIPTDPTQLLIWVIVLIIIGLIIIAVLGFLFAFPIAALAAILVWFLTGGDLFWTAVTFLVVALISAAVGRIWRASYRTGHTHEHTHEHEDEHVHEHD
jgi:membrane protein implicated in regulation of membrane protease activity